MSAVVNDREEVTITRAGHEPVVIVSLDDYESLKETAYLRRSPANAQRLLDSIERLESGHGTEHATAPNRPLTNETGLGPRRLGRLRVVANARSKGSASYLHAAA